MGEIEGKWVGREEVKFRVRKEKLSRRKKDDGQAILLFI